MNEETRMQMLQVGKELTRLGDARRNSKPALKAVRALLYKMEILTGRLEDEYDLR